MPWVTVRVSARILDWPQKCACCCGPADSTVDVSHARTSGVKVVRTAEKEWAVPYCLQCLNHAHHVAQTRATAREAEEVRRKGPDVPRYRDPQQTVAIIGALATLGTALLLFGLPAAGMMFLSKMNPALAFFLALVIGGPPTGLVAWLAYRWYMKAEPQVEPYRQEWERQKAVAVEAFQRSCAEADTRAQAAAKDLAHYESLGCRLDGGQAVEYDGWQGTVHTFRFYNPKYAEAFMAANKDKLV